VHDRDATGGDRTKWIAVVHPGSAFADALIGDDDGGVGWERGERVHPFALDSVPLQDVLDSTEGPGGEGRIAAPMWRIWPAG